MHREGWVFCGADGRFGLMFVPAWDLYPQTPCRTMGVDPNDIALRVQVLTGFELQSGGAIRMLDPSVATASASATHQNVHHKSDFHKDLYKMLQPGSGYCRAVSVLQCNILAKIITSVGQ